MAGSCQHSTESSGSIKYVKFLQQLRNNDLTQKGSDACTKGDKIFKQNKTLGPIQPHFQLTPWADFRGENFRGCESD